MTIVIDIIAALVLLFAGYVYTCCYFNGVKGDLLNKQVIRLTRNKIIYLTAGIAAIGILITAFETIYLLDTISQVKMLSLVMILLPAAAVDLRDQKIPNKLLLAAVAIRIAIYAAEFILSVPAALYTLKDDFLGAAVVGGFFLLLLLIFKNSIGMGDIKLFAVMGLYQGLWGVINSVFFSLVVSFFLSVALLISGKKKRKDTISFGPSIFIGTVIAMGLAGM